MVIFFIGFMGSGKSINGAELATLLNYPFYDLDELIESAAELSIPELFEKRGESAFRTLETNLLRNFPWPNDAVVAVGGGAPCFNNNIEWLKEKGITIYLKAPIHVLINRLKNKAENRPLLANTEDLSSFISRLLEKREEVYASAHVIYEYQFGDENPAEDLFQRFPQWGSKE